MPKITVNGMVEFIYSRFCTI